MIIELGHFALILALLVALIQTVLPCWGAKVGNLSLMRTSEPAAFAQFFLLLVAFFALMHAYVISDFSVENVVRNSHSAKPLLYKISGVWGNHEGSMLLWVLILALCGAAIAAFGKHLPPTLKANVLSVQASIACAFLLFIITTSNPFLRIENAPFEGQGLNPLLQDPALAFHPPFLYAGYVGFSIAFSFAIAALMEGRIEASWARWVRPWTLAAWMFLTLGIAMGSWWAYYELGWGGWWFWDPVENASFMPWLAGTALLHSSLVMEKRNALKVWTILLSILTFSLSLMGTFLVRSGVLTSVHTFAVDPQRGIFILAIMAVFIGGAFTLFAWRAPSLKQGGLFSPISREGSLILNNLLLVTATAAVFIGTLYPLALEAITGAKISVGAPYFNQTFIPLMMPLLLVLPFGPLMAWKRGDFYAVAERLYGAIGAAFLILIFLWAFYWRAPWGALLAFGLGVWLIAGALTDIFARVKLFRAGRVEVWRRLIHLPRSAYGVALAHMGLGISVLGIVATTAWQSEKILTMRQGETVDIAAYTLAFKGVEKQRGPNYHELQGRFEVFREGRFVTLLIPSKRRYQAPKTETSEAGIYAAWGGDLYTVLGDQVSEGVYAVRLYFNPLVRFIWLGAVLMFIAGMISLSDRRYRVGAPKKGMKRVPAFLILFFVFSTAMFFPAPSTLRAVEPSEILSDANLERRARAISAQLRCLVCQNQSIDDSDADLAKDLRILVREHLQAGKNDREIIDFVVARYGEFVLLKPRLTKQTLILWLSPLVILMAASTLLIVSYRRRAREESQGGKEDQLTPQERQKLAELLENEEGRF